MIANKRVFIATKNSQAAPVLTWQEAVIAGPRGVIPALWYAEDLAQVPDDTMALVHAVSAEDVIDPIASAALADLTFAVRREQTGGPRFATLPRACLSLPDRRRAANPPRLSQRLHPVRTGCSTIF